MPKPKPPLQPNSQPTSQPELAVCAGPHRPPQQFPSAERFNETRSPRRHRSQLSRRPATNTVVSAQTAATPPSPVEAAAFPVAKPAATPDAATARAAFATAATLITTAARHRLLRPTRHPSPTPPSKPIARAKYQALHDQISCHPRNPTRQRHGQPHPSPRPCRRSAGSPHHPRPQRPPGQHARLQRRRHPNPAG